MKFFLAIDDTDNAESVGTGRLARMLIEQLQKEGFVTAGSVTRHQLLVHPDIPYTSHNSCACIEAVTMNGGLRKIADRAKNFLVEHFHEGANPGLCVVEKRAVAEDLQNFGFRAQQHVLRLEDARSAAQRTGIYTWWQGDTGQGLIGAMAGVGLRSTGNDGRFIGLKGIREIKGLVRVGEILSQSLVCRVETVSGGILAEHEPVHTKDWVRPSLRNGNPVLVVKKNRTFWVPAEKRKREQQG